MVLISHPASFNPSKVSYNSQKETWSLNVLISHYVQEEERLKLEKTESAHLDFTSKYKWKRPQIRILNGSSKRINQPMLKIFFLEILTT